MGTATHSGEKAEVTMIGLDLAKACSRHVARAHSQRWFPQSAAARTGIDLLAAQARFTLVMEACTSSHPWARVIGGLGRHVRLIAPAYVKPFVKWRKNDATYAEAIAEAATRPTMRFVPVKSEAKQASAVIFRTRDLLVRQRMQIINALRGHMGECGLIAPQGRAHVERLITLIEDPASDVPEAARSCLARLVAVLRGLECDLREPDREIVARQA